MRRFLLPLLLITLLLPSCRTIRHTEDHTDQHHTEINQNQQIDSTAVSAGSHSTDSLQHNISIQDSITTSQRDSTTEHIKETVTTTTDAAGNVTVVQETVTDRTTVSQYDRTELRRQSEQITHLQHQYDSLKYFCNQLQSQLNAIQNDSTSTQIDDQPSEPASSTKPGFFARMVNSLWDFIGRLLLIVLGVAVLFVGIRYGIPVLIKRLSKK